MKYLIIKDNKGYYLRNEKEVEIDKINKDDLLELLNTAESQDFDMDECTEENLENKAHYIIYKNIYNKFSEFLKNKSRFKDDVENLHKDAIDKYSKSEKLGRKPN